jgi:hypothetical protein
MREAGVEVVGSADRSGRVAGNPGRRYNTAIRDDRMTHYFTGVEPTPMPKSPRTSGHLRPVAALPRAVQGGSKKGLLLAVLRNPPAVRPPDPVPKPMPRAEWFQTFSEPVVGRGAVGGRLDLAVQAALHGRQIAWVDRPAADRVERAVVVASSDAERTQRIGEAVTLRLLTPDERAGLRLGSPPDPDEPMFVPFDRSDAGDDSAP